MRVPKPEVRVPKGGMCVHIVTLLMTVVLITSVCRYEALTRLNKIREKQLVGLGLTRRLDTRLHLAYLGVYSSRDWSEEENDLLLSLRAERINPETGRVRRGGWREISSVLSMRLGEKISVEKAQHQADNVKKRRERRASKKSVSEPAASGKLHKWSSRESDMLMLIRSRYLDKNGRVAMGSWAKICDEATMELGFKLTVSQAMKRVQDILRKTAEQEVSGEAKDQYRGWNLEDTRQLVEYVKRADGSDDDADMAVGAAAAQRRPRGFWIEIAQRLNRCPVMCRERYYWLERANAPLFS